MKIDKSKLKIFEYPKGSGIHSHRITHIDFSCHWMVTTNNKLDDVLNAIVENTHPYLFFNGEFDEAFYNYSYLIMADIYDDLSKLSYLIFPDEKRQFQILYKLVLEVLKDKS